MTDAEALEAVAKAFAGVPRPEHFTNPEHCAECREYDELMRSRGLSSLSLQDFSLGWSPLNFLSPEGFRYYFPAFARLALAGDAGEFVELLCFILCQPISKDRPPTHLPQTIGFTREQTAAVLLLLKRLRDKKYPTSGMPTGSEHKEMDRGIRNWKSFFARWEIHVEENPRD